MLPFTTRALQPRFPARIERLSEALGADPSSAAAELTKRSGATRLRDVGVTEAQLAECVVRRLDVIEDDVQGTASKVENTNRVASGTY